MSTIRFAGDEYLSEQLLEAAIRAEEVNPRIFKKKLIFNVVVILLGILTSGICVSLMLSGGIETHPAKRLLVLVALSGVALFLIGIFSLVALISGNIIQQHLNLVAQKFETNKATGETYAVMDAFAYAVGHLEIRTRRMIFDEVQKAPPLREHEVLKDELYERMKIA
jgi:hypothetical protein